MFSKLNYDNLCNILLYHKSINSLNNNLHISKHIYKLIINDYNKLYKNTFILLIRRWRKSANESKLLKSITFKLFNNNNNVLSMYYVYINNNINTNSFIEYNKSLYIIGLQPNWSSILEQNYNIFTLEEFIFIKINYIK